MPYHLDEEHAKQTVVGQLFAPSMFTLSVSTRLTHDTGYYEIATVAGLGIDELRMSKPVLVGDQLQVQVAIVAMRASQSKPGLGVITTKHTVSNQRGEVVLSYVFSALVYKRPRLRQGGNRTQERPLQLALRQTKPIELGQGDR